MNRFIGVFFLIFGCVFSHFPAEGREFSAKPLLLISIDGFRHDYMKTIETPNLRNLSQTGALAEAMIPVFPSLTFPNHYSLVTGLYPENTGLISNTMYDPILDASYSLSNRAAVGDGRWYGGEPIWVTGEKQGMQTATLFWPGSEAEIQGVRPTRWMKYDGGLPDSSRVDKVISWLSGAEGFRPMFATLYFSKVDTYGHHFGVGSDSLIAAVKEIDGVIGYLVRELQRTGLWGEVNLLITSDHGMANLSEDRLIFLDDLIDPADVRVLTYSAVSMIAPGDGKRDAVYAALKAAEAEGAFQVYLKEDIPERFRLKNHHRVPDIVMIADAGWNITTRRFFQSRGVIAAMHGFDNLHPDMAAFFLAHGPAFKRGIAIPAFEIVHVYALMCRVLGLEPAANDGDIEVLEPILK